jgi:hypothetical protein
MSMKDTTTTVCPVIVSHSLIFSETLSYFYFYECPHDPTLMMTEYKCGLPQSPTRMECRVGLWTFEDGIPQTVLRSEARLVWNFLVEMGWVRRDLSQQPSLPQI